MRLALYFLLLIAPIVEANAADKRTISKSDTTSIRIGKISLATFVDEPQCYDIQTDSVTPCPAALRSAFATCSSGEQTAYLCEAGAPVVAKGSNNTPSSFGVFQTRLGGVIGEVVAKAQGTYAQEKMVVSTPQYRPREKDFSAGDLSNLQTFCNAVGDRLVPIARVELGCTLTKTAVTADVKSGLFNFRTSFHGADQRGTGTFEVDELLKREKDRKPNFLTSCTQPEPVAVVLRPRADFCSSAVTAATLQMERQRADALQAGMDEEKAEIISEKAALVTKNASLNDQLVQVNEQVVSMTSAMAGVLEQVNDQIKRQSKERERVRQLEFEALKCQTQVAADRGKSGGELSVSPLLDAPGPPSVRASPRFRWSLRT